MEKEKRDGIIEEKVFFNLINGRYNWKLLSVDNFFNFTFLSFQAFYPHGILLYLYKRR